MQRQSDERQYQRVNTAAQESSTMNSNGNSSSSGGGGGGGGGACGGLVNKTTREWFRSAEMEYVSLGVQEHCAHRVVTDLGRLGVIQFTDVSS
jgi:hypothetical protein